MVPAIETRHLTKVFYSGFLRKEKKALTDLSLIVERGTIFGFLGPNGAGKTTTLKLLTGLIQATSGEAFIFGKSIQDVSARSKLGFLPERPYFYEYLTGLEFLHFCGELFGMDLEARSKKIETLLHLVHLKGSEQIPLGRYSKGMLQRVGLAQALINDPELVILDEPMSGLDPIGRKEVRDIILRLKEEGKTVFFSTHVLSDAEMVCDQVGIIINGRLRSVGSLGTLMVPKVKSIEVTLKGISQEKIQALKPIVDSIRPGDHSFLVTLMDEGHLPKLIAWTQKELVQIVSIIPRKESLEDLFLEEIKEAQL